MKELKEQLNKKVEAEYNSLIETLKKSTPDEIIDRAYEKVAKEEIIFLIRDKELEDEEIKALIKRNNLLGECYDAWLKCDSGFNPMLEYTVDDRIGSIIKDVILDSKQKDYR